ncbi:MAG: hypothetical protein JXR94_21325 [Candidatus Hydrogenedentes bacterium]|nr:hypothetical protein [Candidatus Hydrogenedentota bacterium]
MATTTAGGMRALAFGAAVVCLMLWDGYCAAEDGARPDILNMKIERPIVKSPPPKPKVEIAGDTITIDRGGLAVAYHGARIVERADGALQIVAESMTEGPLGETVKVNGPIPVWGPRVGSSGVWWDLLLQHGIPVCYEWSAVDSQGKKLRAPRMESFRAEAGESADAVLRALMAHCEGLDLYVASGVPWLRPSSTSYTTVSALDVTVSVHASEVSAWEGIKAVVQAVNAVSDMELSLGFAFVDAITRPPAAFTEEKCVSLAVENVTARDALSAVLSQSPVATAFRYYNYGFKESEHGVGGSGRPAIGHIDLYVFEYGDKLTKRQDLTPEEANWWLHELGETRPSVVRGGD